jgi:hypothetical protein
VYDDEGNLRANRHGVLRGCNDTPNVIGRLERLDCGETMDAFWCRPGTPHCGTLPESERILLAREAAEAETAELEEEPLSADEAIGEQLHVEPTGQRGLDTLRP